MHQVRSASLVFVAATWAASATLAIGGGYERAPLRPDADRYLADLKHRRPKAVVLYVGADLQAGVYDPLQENLLHLEWGLERGVVNYRDELNLSDEEVDYIKLIAQGLRTETKQLFDRIQADKEALINACSSAVSEERRGSTAGLAAFTNSGNNRFHKRPVSMLRRGYPPHTLSQTSYSWELATPAESQPRVLQTNAPVLHDDRFVLRSCLAGHLFTLEQFFESVRAAFDPEEHRYVLIINSHGDAGRTLAAPLDRDYRELSDRELTKLLVEHRRRAKNPLGGELNPFLSATHTINLALGSAEPNGARDEPIGQDKGDFICFLIDQFTAAAPMEFPIVVLQSPDSGLRSFFSDVDRQKRTGLAFALQRAIQDRSDTTSDHAIDIGHGKVFEPALIDAANIGYLYTTRVDANDASIDYWRLYDGRYKESREPDLQDAFEGMLQSYVAD